MRRLDRNEKIIISLQVTESPLKCLSFTFNKDVFSLYRNASFSRVSSQLRHVVNRVAALNYFGGVLLDVMTMCTAVV